jgi:hypothetical protein
VRRGDALRRQHRVCATDRADAKKHAVAGAHQGTLAPLIGGPAPPMIPAIDLDDEPDAGREEIGNEAPTNRHLPTEGNTELAAPEQAPQRGLGPGGCVTVSVSAKLEKLLAWGVASAHETSFRPRRVRALPPTAKEP